MTVGVTNAVRAGEPRTLPAKNRAGTINIILITNAALTVSAMVTAVQVITESKTAVLLDRRVRAGRDSRALREPGRMW